MFTGRTLWRTQRVLSSTSSQIASASGLAFTLYPVSDHASKLFDRVLTAGDFRSVASFAGDLFVSGSSSLGRYGSDGKLKQAWYVGQDLPPHPLQGLVVRRGIGIPELWIATDGAGVLIYDGQQLKNLVPAAASQRKVSALLPLSDGRMIIGTLDAGLYVTDGKRLELLHAQFAQTKVTALAGDEDELWIGTRDAGVWMWRAGAATHFEAELPDAQVLSITTGEDAVWVGTPLGVSEFAHGRFRRKLAEGVFAQSLSTHSGLLSIGTLDEGVVNVALTGRALPASGLTRQNVVALEELDGQIVSVSPDNVTRQPSGEQLLGTPDPSARSAHVSALHVDSRGRLWVGYFDRGLDILDQGSARSVSHIEDGVLFCVNRIKEDSQQGTVAVATANGLAFFDAGAQLRQTLDARSGLISNHVTDLLFRRRNPDSTTSLAVATPAGISFVENGSISSLSAFHGLVNNHVLTLAEWDGNLFAGTLGGVSLLQDGLVQTSFTTANSTLSQNWITASAPGPDGMYLGTYGSGVIRVERDSAIRSFREFSRERIEINPNALLATNAFVYAGTAGQGLAVLRLGDTRWHFIRDGLPSWNVTALESHNGILYVGTDNGLVSASEEKLNP